MATVNEYDVGDRPRINLGFENEAGAAADPASVTVTVEKPSGALLTYLYDGVTATLERTGVGAYTVRLPALDEPGRWPYRGVGTGNGIDEAGDHWFLVREPAV